MRRAAVPLLLLLAALLALGWSCRRTPPSPAPSPAAETHDAPPAADAAPAPADTTPDLLATVDATAPTPGDTLQRYVTAVLNRDQAGIDAAWAIAPGSDRQADDAALRLLPDVASLRLQTQSPRAADMQQPTQLLEVPVSLRAATAHGTFRYTGWYRLQPRADRSGWVIHSAKLQPTLD